ncbi:taste receptor type 2 member 40-like [Eublepharis macularius]|uniref:Taste receptor type 2 n=1 Tax=Eublepharis macularius TaxID=481883 RepID=A0AA97JUA0_EUBMA|nr:taste receptor type 2 member 40-like [Eublepharis macularius]
MGSVIPIEKAFVPSSLLAFYLATAGTVYLSVIMTHGLIIVVNLSDWSKGNGLMPNDEILASLALSNLCFSSSSIADYFCSLIWEDFYSVFNKVQRVIFTLDIATSFSSFWFTAWLSVFYCMKIVNFKQAFLLKMKLKFSGLIHWLLLGSTVVSLGAALLFQWAVRITAHGKEAKETSNQTAGLPSTFNGTCNNVNEKPILLHMSPFYRLLIILLGCSVPLMVVVSSSVPVLYSLVRHTQKAEESLSPFQLEAHLSAAKAVLSLLLCYAVLVTSQTLIRMEIFRNWTYQYFLCLSIQLATLLAQSTVLIRSNPKLKQAAAQLLSGLPGYHRKGNNGRRTDSQEV